jgi:predicted kinase
MTISLIMMIGLPGSGKSFAAQQLHHYHLRSPLISTDRIREQLFGDEAIQGAWLRVWREIETQFRLAVTQIQQQQAPLAIYDATNAARRQRKEAIQLAKTVGFNHITGYWLDPPLKTCLQRNQQRHRQVPEEIIHKMHRQLTGAPPSLSDGLDRLVHTLSPVLI